MTDFMPDSPCAEASSSHDSWESTRPPTVREPATPSAQVRGSRRPAGALATDVHELLESMTRKRVPRLEAVRARLEAARAGLDVAGIEHALQGLHAAAGAVDFLAGRSGGERAAEFVRQGHALAAAAANLGQHVPAFLERQALGAPVARLVWIDLVLESGSLQKRVRQGARWLVEMERDLATRRQEAHTALARQAVDALARRGQAMRERLQNAHRLCGHARRVHALCEELATGRAALCDTLQARVRPAGARLDEALQPLLLAAVLRPLVPEELMPAIEARHALQVALMQAAARILRLHADDRELASELAAMEDRARRAG